MNKETETKNGKIMKTEPQITLNLSHNANYDRKFLTKFDSHDSKCSGVEKARGVGVVDFRHIV